MLVEIRVRGTVQGVGFRPFVYRMAHENNLTGYVRNTGDAGVSILLQGEEADIAAFEDDLKNKNPPLARIFDFTSTEVRGGQEFDDFRILESTEASRKAGSSIPPDVSICQRCMEELRNPGNRRYTYFFTTCTDCGPRFTTITGLPYDRPATTMIDFPMCDLCTEEYEDPLDRRFHAQTVACPECGPSVSMLDSDGSTVDLSHPVWEVGKLLDEGCIVAIKGNGGFHLATATSRDDPISTLRERKHRPSKPLAIMARDMRSIRTFADVNTKEESLLTSHIKPILLLNKSRDYWLSDLLSPGLHNIGVMLPYTGLHHMLFDKSTEPAFVMTSANPPGEPIIKENEDALRRLSGIVDYFLVHDRRIAQRCDDSVVRVLDRRSTLIRRSRGYVPEPIPLENSGTDTVLAVGAEQNVTATILHDGKTYCSQHIGDLDSLGSLDHFSQSVEHIMKLTGVEKPDMIACDMHPRFLSTDYARTSAERWSVPLEQIQHHHAHGASLLGEHGLDEIVVFACDGYGYGSDGTAWGGEILHCRGGEYERIGHLEPHPMTGGDLATRYPIRMVAGILRGDDDVENWIMERSDLFPHGREETQVLLQQIDKGVSLQTTSFGRVLDAVSAILDICHLRSYEGEPAMKLESAAIGGRDALQLQPEFHGSEIRTGNLLREVFDRRHQHSRRDLAYSSQSYLASSIAQFGVTKAEELGVDVVGATGGVCYNRQITDVIKEVVERGGLRFLANTRVPPGDGGISFGQAVAASERSR